MWTFSGLDSRLSVLELKYGTNVTGNSFEVTFGTLTRRGGHRRLE